MPNTRRVTITKAGNLRFIYEDGMRGLLAHGEAQIVRASHVEPHPTKPGWLADMRPAGGPVLGMSCALHSLREWDSAIDTLTPFETRQAALDAERAWLQRERGL